MDAIESVPPLDVLLELARAEEASDPFAFRSGEQTYLVRRDGGAVETAALVWGEDLFADLDAAGRGDPVARQRVGERVRSFIAQADGNARERQIDDALSHGRRVHVTLRASAAELYLLPWELITFKATGQHLGELPNCLVRYEWPGTRTATPTPDPPPEGGRILLAWSAAGGAVAVAEHVDAIRRASMGGHYPFDPDRDILPHVSLTGLHEALDAPERPVSVLHLLCHGGPLESRSDAYGLVWDSSSTDDGHTLVDAGALRRLLDRYKGTLQLVVLSACYGANTGAPGNALGAIAQEIHRIGIPTVIASRWPLTVPGSISLTDMLYRRLLVDLTSLEDTFLSARARLVLDAPNPDWASLQLYAREADGADHRPVVFRPYRGLDAFGPTSRRFFFGREREVGELVKILDEGPRMLTLVGASGSGKSSLAMAGLVPAVVEDQKLRKPFQAAILVPGAHPCASLANALASLAGEVAHPLPEQDRLREQPRALRQAADRVLGHQPGDPQLLLVVDQLEELFTQVEDHADAAAFVAALLHAVTEPGSRVHVVLTLRADFLGRCLDFDRNLAQWVKTSAVILLPMNESEIVKAILRPAALAGLRFDDGLVDALLGDEHESGTASDLPLLAFALEELWERRRGGLIPWSAWEAIGGLKGSIAQRADEVLAGCRDDEARQLVRDLFSRLVQLGQGTEDTRCHAELSELRAVAPGRAEAELERWIKARLLTADESHVWIAHEAVIRQWSTLRRWIAEDREALMVRQEIGRASRQWEESGRSADELWRGARLGRAVELLEVRRLRLTKEETAFLEAGNAARRAEVDAKQAQHKKALRRSRILAGAAVGVSLLTVGEVEHVRRKAHAADDASRVANAAELVSANQPGAAAQLLLQVESPASHGWEQAALDVLGSTVSGETFRGHEGPVASVAVTPDEKHIVTASWDKTVRVWSVDDADKRPPIVLKGHEGRLRSAMLSPDGRRIVTASMDKTARIWNTDGSNAEDPIVLKGHEAPLSSAKFSPDGRHVVTTSYDGTARIWNADGSNKDAPIVLDGKGGGVNGAVFSSDGKQVVTVSDDALARVWRVDGSDRQHPLVLRGHKARIDLVAFGAGGRIATASADNTAIVWKADGSDRNNPVVLRGHGAHITWVAFSDDGRRIVTTSVDKTARVWKADGSDKDHPLILSGHEERVMGAVFSPDGEHVATSSEDGTVRVWSINHTYYAPIILRGHESAVAPIVYSPDGRRIVTGSWDKTMRVWSIDESKSAGGAAFQLVLPSPDGHHTLRTKAWDEQEPEVLEVDASREAHHWNLEGHRARVGSASFSSDGRRIVTGSDDKTARVWRADESGKKEPVILDGHTGDIRNVAFSKDGRFVATGSEDNTARVWRADGSDKKDPVVLRGHSHAIWSVAFSPDGEYLLTGSEDKTARVWRADGSNKDAPLVLEGHQGEIESAVFAPMASPSPRHRGTGPCACGAPMDPTRIIPSF
ncbi:High-affnity carbon uptake protein Hat/HatR [Minicystis rosea]|nr:High-affnity carbon uptake protein Hat/HatR [Minicystis rosea]